MKAKTKKYDAVFKWVQYTPIGNIKKLNDEDLIQIRQDLIKEVREVGRALQWVEGIVKLKMIERKSQPQKSKEVRS